VATTLYYVAQPGQLPVSGQPFGGAGGFGRPPSIDQLNSGRMFVVTPTVSGDRKYVTLELRPQFQSVEFDDFLDATGPLQLPRNTYTTIATTVTVPDRGWLLLGGLKQSGETEVEAGVPILSKLPVLKRAFTNRSRVKDERVLLMLVKPTIIIQGELEDEAFPDLATSDEIAGS
jgi:type II secretory pathway component GspD/PulD (secretin)